MSVIDKPITELEEPEVLDEVDQILLDAEQHMREHGWCPQAASGNKICVLVALANAHSIGNRHWQEAIMRLRKATGTYDIPAWNDHICKSQEEALSAFQRARNLPK